MQLATLFYTRLATCQRRLAFLVTVWDTFGLLCHPNLGKSLTAVPRTNAIAIHMLQYECRKLLAEIFTLTTVGYHYQRTQQADNCEKSDHMLLN
jgi:hypothetical protein